MRHTDEKQPLMVQIMAALEGVRRERQTSVLGNLPARAYKQMPAPHAKAPPNMYIPPPSPKQTTYNETASEVHQPRSILSGVLVGNHSTKRAWIQDLIDMLDENCITGSSGVTLGRRDNGRTLLKSIEPGKDSAPATCLPQAMGEGNMRTGLLDCNPLYDHDGRRWEDIGIAFPTLCSNMNMSPR